MGKTVRHSKKREAILEALRGTKSHPSAEWIYQTLKPDNPGLSLGTVYRNLSFFLEQGTVKRVGVVNGQERFDADMSPHSHFVCRGCGGVFDLPWPEDLDGLAHTAGEELGFQTERCEVIFHGLCGKCRENSKTMS